MKLEIDRLSNSRRVTVRHLMICLSVLTLAACQTTDHRYASRVMSDEASYAVTGSSEILVLYIGAIDCPPCRRFKAADYPRWARSEEIKHIQYRELEFPYFENTSEDWYWPENLRWVRNTAYADSGTPRWIVAVDGHIVSNTRSWKGKTYPLIQRLVARKLNG